MIEKQLDLPFIAELALHEKQIQQNYRPVIAVHKWFARRPGTLFRSLLLAEFVPGNLRENFFRAHNLKGLRIADPFMGGGTPLIEANRLGCDVVGCDINPMSYWIVRQELEYLDLEAYRYAAREIRNYLQREVGYLYQTKCTKCGNEEAFVKYFIWVKTAKCSKCGHAGDLFPGYLLAENVRHPKNVFICASCGNLNEVLDRRHPGSCSTCGHKLEFYGPARRNQWQCARCGMINVYGTGKMTAPPTHRMVALEYHCPRCRPIHRGRFFKKPDEKDLERYEEAAFRLAHLSPFFIPEEEIPAGDETDRLHRWGYRRYREMFNERQLLGLELICRAIVQVKDIRIRNALATNLSDLLRYQNMLCRYDTMALKSLDIFSVHGFPVSLVQCESNLIGITDGETAANVGSGGWTNIVDKYIKAKEYCAYPFEIRHGKNRKHLLFVVGEWIGDRRPESEEERRVELYCTSATELDLPPASLDAVFTDPPYYANVQYAELMDFCYVWLRKLVVDEKDIFAKISTRDERDLTGNITMERGLNHFAAGLAEVFKRMRVALKPGRPLVFTYHHKTIEAYYPIAMALLDAGFVCSASFPCPAEMGASIHINGTSSSIIDTVFVCRSTGRIAKYLIVTTPMEFAALVQKDLARLKEGGMSPSVGDIRCVAYGHLIRMAIWELRLNWDVDRPIEEKLDRIAQAVKSFGGWEAIEKHLYTDLQSAPKLQHWVAKEKEIPFRGVEDEIPF